MPTFYHHGGGVRQGFAAEFAAMGAFMESFGQDLAESGGTGRRAGPDRPGAHRSKPPPGRGLTCMEAQMNKEFTATLVQSEAKGGWTYLVWPE
jgi:hypothetical protein